MDRRRRETQVLVFEAQYAAARRRAAPARGGHRTLHLHRRPSPPWAEPYEAVLASGDDAGPPMRASADDALCIIYTSGTTGRPKGVVHSNRAYASSPRSCRASCSSAATASCSRSRPLFHIGARSLSSGAHWRGGTVVLHRGFDAQEVIRTIERERITAVHLVPTMVQAILDAPELRAITTCRACAC